MINLDNLKAKAEAATPDWQHRTTEADAAYIAAFPMDLPWLPLIKALIEWRNSWVDYDLARYEKAHTNLLTLIGGMPEQETNNDAG